MLKGGRMETVMTITGIRPDFIRMSEIFKKLDQNFKHILVHTGQHYDEMLSEIFFKELQIRQPDYNLGIGCNGKRHHEQLADLSVGIIKLLEKENLEPDIILFLGDSNSVLGAVPLKKEGFKIGHIESGMRSYDRRMLEETNRIVCDHCSDLLFVYHQDYATNCICEGINNNGIYIVGNTIVEVCRQFELASKKRYDHIILDIHRPENFNSPTRMKNIIEFASQCANEFQVPVCMLQFPITMSKIANYELPLKDIQPIGMMSYRNFLHDQYHSLFMISDSGTAQEEPSLFNVPVVVPRDFTERPQSVFNSCSVMLDVNSANNLTWCNSQKYVKSIHNGMVSMNTNWLGDGKTSDYIISALKESL